MFFCSVLQAASGRIPLGEMTRLLEQAILAHASLTSAVASSFTDIQTSGGIDSLAAAAGGLSVGPAACTAPDSTAPALGALKGAPAAPLSAFSSGFISQPPQAYGASPEHQQQQQPAGGPCTLEQQQERPSAPGTFQQHRPLGFGTWPSVMLIAVMLPRP